MLVPALKFIGHIDPTIVNILVLFNQMVSTLHHVEQNGCKFHQPPKKIITVIINFIILNSAKTLLKCFVKHSDIP